MSKLTAIEAISNETVQAGELNLGSEETHATGFQLATDENGVTAAVEDAVSEIATSEKTESAYALANKLVEVLKPTVKDDNDGIDKNAAAVQSVAVEAIATLVSNQVDIQEEVDMVALEGHDSVNTRVVCTEAIIDSVKGAAKNIWELVLKAYRAIVKAISTVADKIIAYFTSAGKRMSVLKKRVHETKGEAKNKEFTDAKLGFLTSASKIDASSASKLGETMMTGTSNLVDSMKDTLALDEVKDESALLKATWTTLTDSLKDAPSNSDSTYGPLPNGKYIKLDQDTDGELTGVTTLDKKVTSEEAKKATFDTLDKDSMLVTLNYGETTLKQIANIKKIKEANNKNLAELEKVAKKADKDVEDKDKAKAKVVKLLSKVVSKVTTSTLKAQADSITIAIRHVELSLAQYK